MSWSPMGDVPNPIFDTNGDAYSGAVLKAYLPGTTTSTSIAIDSAGSSPQTSITANADGIWEVSSSEIVPHIDRKHKWAVFANATDATANTPAYMGFMDNIEQVSTSGLAGGAVATIAALKALTGQSDNDGINVLGHAAEGDGGGGSFFFDSSSSATDDNGLVIQPTAGSGRWIRNYSGAINVLWFAAKGDSSTDDLAAFDACELAANSNRTAMYIPGLALGKFYKLSDVWNIASRDFLKIYGDGPNSAIVSYNEAAANVMELDSSRGCWVDGISLNGIVGGGNGLVIMDTGSNSPCHYTKVTNVWLQDFDGDCLVLESGQSCEFTNVRCEVGISGINVPTLTGGKTKGSRQRGIYVKSISSGDTNNATFTNCYIDNAYGTGATDYALQVGTAGAESVGSFVWHGGLIQGGDSNLVYLQCLDGSIKDCHIEASLSATKYEITFKNCTDTYIEGGHGQGDVLFDGANIRCGLINRKANGISISATSREILIDGISLQNGGNGPVGKFIDLGVDTKVIRCVGGANGSAIRYTVGDILTGARIPWMTNSMENWRGGGTPSLPGGFATFDPGAYSGMTVSREATTVRTGAYSIKQVTTTASGNAYEQGTSFQLTPIDDTMRYFITAWVYVTTGSASLRLWIDSGTSTSDYACTTTGQWVKLQMTVTPSSDTKIEVILAAAKSSTVYWDSVSVIAEDFTPITYKTATDAATTKLGPNGDGTGYHIPTYLFTGTTAVTSIVGAWPGKPFIAIFDANKTMTDNSDIVLNGSGNFAATATDTLTLVLDETTGKHYELARSVN